MKKVLLLALVLLSCERSDFLFTNGSGGNFRDYQDQVIFLNIWADWCPPCIVEFPYFNEIDKDQNISVIGFHFDQFDILSDKEVNQLMDKFDIQFQNLSSDPRQLWETELPESVPTTYIIKNGQVKEAVSYPLTLEKLKELASNH